MFWLLPLLSLTAHASDVPLTATAGALGSTSVANPFDNTTIASNPGMLALTDRYEFHVFGGIGPSGGLQWGAGGVDGTTSEAFSLGLQYSGDKYEPALSVREYPGWSRPGAEISNNKIDHDVTGALSFSAFERRFAAGFAGNIRSYSHDRNGKGTTGNVHVGLGFRPVDVWTIGLSGRNLIPLNNQWDRPMQALAGTRLGDDWGSISFEGGAQLTELTNSQSPLLLRSGIEGRLTEAALRAGWSYDGPADQHNLTTGFGLISESISLDYAVQIPLVSDLALGSLTHVLSVNISGPDFSAENNGFR